MTKQLNFYFGDYDEEKIIDTVKKEFQWLLDKKYPLQFKIHLGDEMDPFKSVYINYIHYNEDMETYEIELLDTVNMSPQINKLFEDFKGEDALSIMSEVAHTKSIKINKMIVNFLETQRSVAWQ
jgi:hypothetical protein